VLFRSNSIVAGNALLSCDGTVVDGGHDIAVPDVACPGANVDPLLAALADNGGPSRTQALLPRSPAIDALPASGAGCPATDERGVPRPQGPACDIGAYEVGVGAAAGSGGVVLARLTKLGLSPKSFRAAAKGASAAAAKRRRRTGTTVTYTLNEAATVRFSLVRPRGGRRAGKRCVKPTKRNRKGRACTRLVKVSGSFTRRSSLGRNRFHFTGRLKGRKLKVGAYRLVATPSAAGRKGKTVSAAFRIVA